MEAVRNAYYIFMIAGLAISGGCSVEDEHKSEIWSCEDQGVLCPPDWNQFDDVQDHLLRSVRRSGDLSPVSFYYPTQSSLRLDIDGLLASMDDCSRRDCHMAIVSENLAYLVDVIEATCESYASRSRSSHAMHIYLYIDDQYVDRAMDAISACDQHVVLYERSSKKELVQRSPIVNP